MSVNLKDQSRAHSPAQEELLLSIQKETFDYFIHEANEENGLIRNKTEDDSPCSIAAVGLALSAYPVGVERSFISRTTAVERTLTTLRFFYDSSQSDEPDATGYKGFYYHFLDMKTGRRVWQCELSTIDTAFLLAGMLAAAAYFDGDNADEQEIRELAEAIYRRVDWFWALNGAKTVSHGWKPESGFLPYTWQGYSEAMILYVLGLGSPTHSLAIENYQAWASTYEWKNIYNYEYLYAGPLFIHQLSHVWIDFRGIQDEVMRAHDSDYFENSRRATYVQQQYAIRNPLEFEGYDEVCWGITASDGPGPASKKIDGIAREFYDYEARGVPYGPDDGTIAPWSAVGSLPFAPEIVLPTIDHFNQFRLREANPYGFKATFNQTFPTQHHKSYGWVSPWHYGLNEGPVVLMIENYLTGFPWQLMKRCSYLVSGLRRAGFADGWLSSSS